MVDSLECYVIYVVSHHKSGYATQEDEVLLLNVTNHSYIIKTKTQLANEMTKNAVFAKAMYNVDISNFSKHLECTYYGFSLLPKVNLVTGINEFNQLTLVLKKIVKKSNNYSKSNPVYENTYLVCRYLPDSEINPNDKNQMLLVFPNNTHQAISIEYHTEESLLNISKNYPILNKIKNKIRCKREGIKRTDENVKKVDVNAKYRIMLAGGKYKALLDEPYYSSIRQTYPMLRQLDMKHDKLNEDLPPKNKLDTSKFREMEVGDITKSNYLGKLYIREQVGNNLDLMMDVDGGCIYKRDKVCKCFQSDNFIGWANLITKLSQPYDELYDFDLNGDVIENGHCTVIYSGEDGMIKAYEIKTGGTVDIDNLLYIPKELGNNSYTRILRQLTHRFNIGLNHKDSSGAFSIVEIAVGGKVLYLTLIRDTVHESNRRYPYDLQQNYYFSSIDNWSENGATIGMFLKKDDIVFLGGDERLANLNKVPTVNGNLLPPSFMSSDKEYMNSYEIRPIVRGSNNRIMYYDANAQKFILMSNVYNYYSPVEKDLIVEDVCNLEDVDECDWPEMKYFTTFKSEDELLSSVNYLRILNKAISLVDCSRLNKPNIAFERYCYENGINNKESIDEKFIELLKNSNFIEMKRRQPDRLENKVGIEVEILKLKGTNKSIIVYNNKRSNYCFIYEDESDESKPKNLPVEMIHCELSLGHLILLAYSIGGWLKNTNIERNLYSRDEIHYYKVSDIKGLKKLMTFQIKSDIYYLLMLAMDTINNNFLVCAVLDDMSRLTKSIKEDTEFNIIRAFKNLTHATLFFKEYCRTLNNSLETR